MKQFKTITEVKVLYHALNDLYRVLEKENKRLEERPDSQISKYRVEKLTAQTDEIHGRILALERAAERRESK